MPGAVPQGRAGRLWLLGRLDVARRAADLLERKEALLRSEERRLRQLASHTAEVWAETCREVEAWTTRAVLLSGPRDLRAPSEPAAAVIVWQNAMGLTYPSEAACRLPRAVQRPSANPALGLATAASRRAVEAAVQHAAASYAYAEVAAELSASRRRRRAIVERWIPDLEDHLTRLEAQLDELEREEFVRIRWGLRRATRTRR